MVGREGRRYIAVLRLRELGSAQSQRSGHICQKTVEACGKRINGAWRVTEGQWAMGYGHTSITIQQGGCGAVQRCASLVGDEHGYPSAILAADKLLLGLKLLSGRVAALQLRLSEQLWLCLV